MDIVRIAVCLISILYYLKYYNVMLTWEIILNKSANEQRGKYGLYYIRTHIHTHNAVCFNKISI